MSSCRDFTDAELAAYVSETLSVERSVALENELRTSTALRERLRGVLATSDQGTLSVGALWQQQRVSCPGRSTWAAYLAGELGGGLTGYLQFHLDEIGCRFCAANVADLKANDPDAERRTRKYFETSVGRLSQVAAEDVE
ncbi:MAG TPA: hypothetical protein VM165_07545 [Planctomycetaceae bacterium]|nr:hypothetical protein [Planctomycetaceae bacterium]